MPDGASSRLATSFNFDRVAEEYEATRYLPPVIADRVASLVVGGMAEEEWFLDAGVGTGRLGRALTARHRHTAGVDISPRMLDQFRGATQSDIAAPHLALADLRTLPFSDSAFSGILSVHVLHLIPEWRRALEELWRALRGGGTLTLGVEDWSASPTRQYFLGIASERGLFAQSRRGAYSSDLVATLREWTRDVEERRPPSLQWRHQIDAQTTLNALERRTYSSLWSIPEDAMTLLINETRQWAQEYYSTTDLGGIVELQEARMTLYSARKS